MTTSLVLRHATLRVRDRHVSAAFYVDLLGLEVVAEDPGAGAAARADGARLALAFPGATAPWLTLVETPGAVPAAPLSARLYHLAVLLADRPHLGAVLQRLATAGWPLQGLSDHGVSEALYLADPDGHGLEFYADRPAAVWPRDAAGGIAMFTAPADVRSLVREAAALPAGELFRGARFGHVHLHVTDLARARAFYVETLGLTEMARLGGSASFLAADGYHHHLAVNTWGQPHAPVNPAALGLGEVTVARRDDAAAADPSAARVVHDPDGHRWRIEALA